MMKTRISGALALVTLLATAAACSSSSSGTTTSGGDAGKVKDTGVDAVSLSECGHPGDKGNELGVGKFCQTVADCSSNSKATLCTTIADNVNFFCTASCSAGGAADQCGTAASCACQGGQCGCHPDACGGAIDSGASQDSGGD